MVRARDWLGHLDITLGACQEHCVDLWSTEYEECGVGSMWSLIGQILGPFSWIGAKWTHLFIQFLVILHHSRGASGCT